MDTDKARYGPLTHAVKAGELVTHANSGLGVGVALTAEVDMPVGTIMELNPDTGKLRPWTNGEGEQVTEFTVRLRWFGKPDQLPQTTAHLMRAIEHAFPSERVEVLVDGKPAKWDSWADDGHHPGHDTTLEIDGEPVIGTATHEAP